MAETDTDQETFKSRIEMSLNLARQTAASWVTGDWPDDDPNEEISATTIMGKSNRLGLGAKASTLPKPSLVDEHLKKKLIGSAIRKSEKADANSDKGKTGETAGRATTSKSVSEEDSKLSAVGKAKKESAGTQGLDPNRKRTQTDVLEHYLSKKRKPH
ncbi:hypothetical protein M427DRAFT_432717 [Gonapodya prolifera JEL478]|uniref:Uncharacterized protein n=1 Tax=Gonapodya prolifera (strain JEL478) TaxID=1344416 RepID=A0A139AT34_GONPJ|nr:hypothetical protein M427DRAFT_432717 [Gonapodya prolifera JEL478]|eukprot:KXS19896.1 hypothetical protein M427DRAFT_432717 [Gonapodya prolifera JEL478]